MRSIPCPHFASQDTHVILFWCRVSRVVLRSSVVALLSIFRKRSIAEILRWMLCFGMSSFETKVSKPRSSQLKSMGQQSWPCNHTPWEHVKNQGFSCSVVVNCRNVMTPWHILLITNFTTHGVFLTLQNTAILYKEKIKTLTAATTLFSETNDTLRSGRNSVFSCETLNTRMFVKDFSETSHLWFQ